MRNIYLVFFLLLAISTTAMSQNRNRKKKKDRRRFKASLVVGAYGTQIDGDNYNGYNKLSLSGGLRAIAILNDHFDANIELLYQEKGSSIETVLGQERNRKIHLAYMEIPFLIRYFPGQKERGVSLETGLAFARRIGSKITEAPLGYRISYEDISN